MHSSSQSRRTFLQLAGAAAAVPWLGASGFARARTSEFDPSFGTACAALEALRARHISSHELTAHVFARIRTHNPSFNAFITLLEAEALSQATLADQERSRGKQLGILHGLPVLMKDVFMTKGVRTTAGTLQYKDLIAGEDATVVARMKAAGAIIVGKTSLPENGLDSQTYNPIIGQTNNPWDLTRTPGGSTGGGAAALAAGMGFLETGSDIGGSIRTPSHFCGLFGHKSSLDLVPTFGHVPPPPGLPWTNPLIVMGPLARSAEDLALALSVIGGPEEAGLRLALPKPRKGHLREYRIGFVRDDPFCPVDPEVLAVFDATLEALRAEGVTLVEGWPDRITLKDTTDLYYYVLGGVIGGTVPAQTGAQFADQVAKGLTHDPYLLGVVASHLDYALKDQQRLLHRQYWQTYFQRFDAFLTPPHFIPAFPHDQREPRTLRILRTSDGQSRPYREALTWITPASLTGLPATIVPVDRTPAGLPVGVQIIGPYYEDATPLDLAQKIGALFGGFAPPPAFAT